MWFPATLEQLPQMLGFIRDRAQSLGVTKEIIQKLELSCEEAIVNIISYAFREGEEGIIEISGEKQGARFEVVIKDHGQPFNPIESEIDPQFNVPIHQRELGGLGIFLIRKLMDESTYQRVGDENILRMAIRLDISH